MNSCTVFLVLFALLAASLPAMAQTAPATNAPSRVTVVEDPSLVSRFQVDGPRAARAFQTALLRLTQTKTPAEAWSRLVQPGDTVGIRITCPGNPVLAPPRALIDEMVVGLKQAGVRPSQIIVWDKFQDLMIASGYIPGKSASNWQIRSVLPGRNFDPEKFYFNEVVGKLIWGDHEFVGRQDFDLANIAARAVRKKNDPEDPATPATPPPPDQLSNRSHFALLTTRQTTKLINVAVLTDHPDAGIYGACASLAMAAVDNNRRFVGPGANGVPAIGEILRHEAIRDKVVLHVMTGLTAQFAGGPDFNPHYTEPAGLIYLSHDPVAIDTLALARLEAWRKARNVVPIGNLAAHLASAASLGAGKNDSASIQVVTVPPADR
jgi:hypothetical protein